MRSCQPLQYVPRRMEPKKSVLQYYKCIGVDKMNEQKTIEPKIKLNIKGVNVTVSFAKENNVDIKSTLFSMLSNIYKEHLKSEIPCEIIPSEI